MRLRALHWVLNQPLRSSPKFVLLVLALLGDDDGVAYPSQAWLARATGRDIKTVRAALAELKSLKLLTSRSRRRAGQGFTSNVYCLRIPMEALQGNRPGHHAPRQGALRPRDGGTMGYQQQTDIEVQQQKDNTARAAPREAVQDVVLPKGLSEKEAASIARALPRKAAVAQQIVDELAARMARGEVRSPVRYALNLIARHYGGEFIPDLGLRVAGERLAQPAAREGEPAAADRSKQLSEVLHGLTAQKVISMPSRKRRGSP